MLVEVPRNTVMQGHVLDKLRELPSDCVDVVVTSTPYYGLRDYGPDCVSVWDGKADCKHDWQPYNFSLHNGRGDAQKSAKFSEQQNIPDLKLTNASCSKCGAWQGQLGLEPHPNLFIEHLAQVFLELKRVLKPSGSLWLNLGDTYFGGNLTNGMADDYKSLSTVNKEKYSSESFNAFIKERNKLRSNWLQPKQKMLIPARVAIALQEQGWVLRNEIVWHKINHMPESCRDRLTRSWESVYFFTKADKYYFNLDAIRKAHILGDTGKRNNKANKWIGNSKSPLLNHAGVSVNPLGANPGDVWSLTTEGLKDEHFAAFPQKLVRRILECSTPKGGLVLDPFAGAGTSLLVAHKMGFDWLGIELVPKYCKIIEKRIERHGKIRLDKFMPYNSSEKNGGANE
jgi:site-specific DNA-methyltransferase (cytosine-N4-specific)